MKNLTQKTAGVRYVHGTVWHVLPDAPTRVFDSAALPRGIAAFFPKKSYRNSSGFIFVNTKIINYRASQGTVISLKIKPGIDY